MVSIDDDTVAVVPEQSGRRRRLLWVALGIVAIAAIALVLTLTGRPGSGLVGSGSSLAAPLVQRAAVDFRNAANADDPQRADASGNDWVVDGSGIEYEAVGSLGGIVALTDGRASFALADYPLSAGELEQRDIAQFPLFIGALAVVTHQDVAGGDELRLDGEVLAAIYLGEITRWDDEAIATLNPDAELAATEIVPVHRGDGSGSTYGFTRYLADVSDEWGAGPGHGALVSWPAGVGTSADGSGGVVESVSSTPGAIGYVDVGQAERASLPVAAVGNGAGEYATPSAEAIETAIADTDWTTDDDYATPTVATGTTPGYPLTVAVYGMVKRDAGASLTRQAPSFMAFLLDESDVAARDLGYVPLPEAGSVAVREYWAEQLGYA